MDFNSIMIGSSDAKRLAEYYTKVLGKPSMEVDDFCGWQIGTGWITVGPHSDVNGKNAQPGRLMWNIETCDVKSEFEKLRTAGAIVVREP